MTWANLELDAGRMHIVQQLLVPGPTPVYGPPKTGRPRTISLGTETVDLLRTHKAHQASVKMANRTTYCDLGLVFAKEWADVGTRSETLGHPLQLNNLGQREYPKLITAAGVRWIKFHGLAPYVRHVVAAGGAADPRRQ